MALNDRMMISISNTLLEHLFVQNTKDGMFSNVIMVSFWIEKEQIYIVTEINVEN